MMPGSARRRAFAAGLLPLLLAGCGGGGDVGGNAPGNPVVVPRMVDVDAVRLAEQASFGASTPLIDHMTAGTTDAWLDEQFAASGSSYTDLAALSVTRDYCTVNAPNDNGVCNRRYFSTQPVAMRFYADAVAQPDQLRQRVAFALSQLLVSSDIEVQSTAGLASLNQIFLANAFGNYRDILKAVTLNAYMGDYLDMADSSKTAPSENYAREFLQLFSMGPDALNMDGTPKHDANGATVPNYTPDDIKAVARALTGWTYARLNGAAISDGNARDYANPMIMVASRYDTGEKDFFGNTIAAGATQDASVQGVVDAAFNNASTPPFVAKFLIQNLVTANPSPAYVGRVAAAFVNNGSGARGDLKAVVRAILTDAEARGSVRTDAGAGKVKEPILMMVALSRAVGMTSDGYAFTARDAALGQQVFRAPSVFNFYPPNYPLPQSTTLLSPASKLMTTGYIVQRHNFVWDWTISGESRSEFAAQASIAGSTGSTLDWAGWQTTGGDVEALMDRLNLLLIAKTMTTPQRDALRRALLAVTNADPLVQARKRAEAGFYIVATSPQFQVDR